MDRQFSGKLEELREECERFMLSMDTIGDMDIEELETKAEDLKREEQDYMLSLKQRCSNGCDKAENGFCAMQLEHLKGLESIIESVSFDLPGDDTPLAESEKEAAALCTEYAIDGAVSAIRRVCINTLKTVITEKRENKG